jgi:hypothetical protein
MSGGKYWGWHGTLAELAACDQSPTSDGMLLDWVEAQQPSTTDIASIIALLGRPDPHLQEAGVQLATMVLRASPPAAASFEPALAALATADRDPYVLEELATLLGEIPLDTVIDALARHHLAAVALREQPLPETPPTARRDHIYILRNRRPEPWLLLERLYARLALEAGDAPTSRDLAYLPVLEARHGTRGWNATVEHLRALMRG